VTVLRGRTVVPGVVEGEALVSHETISGWGGIDPATGTIIERRHELCGVCFTGKILVFPGAKGSSGWSGFFQTTRLRPDRNDLHRHDDEGGAGCGGDKGPGPVRPGRGPDEGDQNRRLAKTGRDGRQGGGPKATSHIGC
jgi:hypothetical protein